MLLEIPIAIVAGVAAGVVTGLTPGLHINTVALAALAVAPALSSSLGVGLLALALAIVAMSVTHTFLDFIPAIFLGAPREDSALAVLPAHRFLLKGMGYEAAKLTAAGGLASTLLFLLALPAFLFGIPAFYGLIKRWMGWALLAIVAFMLLRSREPNKIFWAAFCFGLAGVLGLLTFELGLKEPLYPLFAGLFGLSLIITTLAQKSEIPEQELGKSVKLPKRALFKAGAIATFSGTLMTIFPALGPAQAAVLGALLIGSISAAGYLVLLGGINTAAMLASLVTLFSISKPRNGSIVVVQRLLGSIEAEHFALFIAAAAAAAGMATLLVLLFGRLAARTLNRLNYRWLCAAVALLLIAFAIWLSGWLGLLVLAVGAAIGLLPGPLGVPRSTLMGCLLLPVILYYLL